MTDTNKSILIFGNDLGDGVKADAMAIAQALADRQIKKDDVKPLKAKMTGAEISALEDAGYAFEANGEAAYVVHGFDNVTLLNELNRRVQGYEKFYSATSKLVEKGPF